MLGGCATKKEQAAAPEAPEIVSAPRGPVTGGGAQQLPRAKAYRMNGDYAANVPVQVGADGNITSYPAPADVRGQEPVALAGGWWLDRRGISRRSVFTRYTYGEYAALASAPSIAELKAAIIEGARPVDIVELPMTPQQALADTAAVNARLKEISAGD